jgi:hypothetical protein
LLLVGVYDHCTPSLASEIGVLVSLTSLEEARLLLHERGVVLNIKTIRAIAYQMAGRVRLLQRLHGIHFKEQLTGRRVVISTDGGRLRLRRRTQRHTSNGRAPYDTDWREPKLLIIYVVDEHGRLDQTFTPLIDGTLGDANAIFGWISYYLRQLDITGADHVLFIADGARWIWSRVAELVRSLGLAPQQVSELVDFYHAVQHLAAIADLRSKWSAAERKSWLARQRQRLKLGQLDQVIAAIRLAFPTKMRAKVQHELEYFLTNQARMAYQVVAQRQLPIGSGAIESAIRRVVNLRLKGAGTFWLQASAEAVLLLRAFFKAGRWKLFTQWAFTPVLLDDLCPHSP